MEKTGQIAIRAFCDKHIGTGHLQRSITLADELRNRGFKVILITEENPLSRDILRRFNGIVHYVLPHILLPEFRSKLNALVLDMPASQDSLLEKPHILAQLSLLNDSGVNIVSVGHVGRNSQSFRAVIDLYPSQVIHAANYFEGPEFLILRPEFMEDPGDESKEPCILISMGGSDPHNLTNIALTDVLNTGYAGNVFVILGAGYSSQREGELKSKIKGSNPSVTFHRHVKDMRSLMRQASIALVAFGTTAYELMSQKIPLLAYTHYQWQVPSAKLFENLGCCVYLGCAQSPDEIKSLAPRIQKCIESPASMSEMAERGRNIVDGKGASRVANLIGKMVCQAEEDQILDVLFVLAHPGDELLGCGGTFLHHVYNKDRVGLVILGDGVSSRRKESDDEASIMAAKRELRKALQGVVDKLNLQTWYYFRFEDNRFDKHDLLDLIKPLESILKRHHPRIVYTNYSGDLNIDHRRTFEAVATALRPEPGQRLSYLFSVEVPTSTDWGLPRDSFQPNWFVDITAYLSEKMDLLDLYRNELKQDPHLQSVEGIRERAFQWGRFCGVKAAEAFVLHRHIEKSNED
jgi:N-acetylglucosamine malate deacetylase 1